MLVQSTCRSARALVLLRSPPPCKQVVAAAAAVVIMCCAIAVWHTTNGCRSHSEHGIEAAAAWYRGSEWFCLLQQNLPLPDRPKPWTLKLRKSHSFILPLPDSHTGGSWQCYCCSAAHSCTGWQ
jgi:hypothetical protein